MNTYQRFISSLLRKAVQGMALAALLLAGAPLFAQDASVKNVGVYYQNGSLFTNASSTDNTVNGKGMYCDWSTDEDAIGWPRNTSTSERTYNRSFLIGSQYSPSGNQNGEDPWVSSALIEYDQPYPATDVANIYPNHCLALCMDVYCNNAPVGQTTYSIAFPLQNITFDIVKYYNGKNLKNADDASPVRTIDIFPMANPEADPTSYICGSYHCSNAGKVCNLNLFQEIADFWKKYCQNGDMGECLGAHWRCDKKWCWPSTSSRAVACKNGDTSYCVSGKEGTKVSGAAGECYCYKSVGSEYGTTGGGDEGCRIQDASATKYNGCCEYAGHSDCVLFDENGAESNAPLSFCTAWDGSYEVMPGGGEFGKTNGNYGFRATVATHMPGDGVAVEQIEFQSTIVYPGMNQIPIQVDVTNVHTVRSTPTMVGNITSVGAQPYALVYRLSKDADVRVAIFDASTSDGAAYEGHHVIGCGTTYSVPHSICDGYADRAWYIIGGTGKCCKKGTEQYSSGESSTIDFASSDADAEKRIVRTLVDWQPRHGEGMKGQDSDPQVQESESWDGRNNDGLLLPAGNYIASIQAKTQDEWPGIDFSRAVTRQLSLDPLKLTDVQVGGLTKQSTAYALISYVATEASHVYWEVYTPGTNFGALTGSYESGYTLTDSSDPTGTSPFVRGGSLVYRDVQERSGRVNYFTKWDGLCHADPTHAYTIAPTATYPTGALDENGNSKTGACSGSTPCTYYLDKCIFTRAKGEKMSDGTICGSDTCTETILDGAPVPDGNYVYVLWAEIPYNGCYYNASASTDTIHTTAGVANFYPGEACKPGHNGTQFTGVKTIKYSIGQLPVERGLVGITMQPVSYSTVGSSPTAYGLDPFIFKYALDREASVIATIENTAGVVVKYLTPKTGITQVAQQLNTLSWDGLDDQGRYVTPGTYMFKVRAYDAMFPAQSNQAVTIFPVDLLRVVDVATTDVYGDSDARATISYLLSKAMNVQVNIYNKDIIIPSYNNKTGDYEGYEVTATYNAELKDQTAAQIAAGVNVTPVGGYAAASGALPTSGSVATYDTANVVRNIWTIYQQTDGNYTVTLKQEKVTPSTATAQATWPPRLCNKTDTGIWYVAADPEVVAGKAAAGAVNPEKITEANACIYSNDPFFTNYPATAAVAASGVVDVRLQPVKTFDRSALKAGDGIQIMEEWDALYFYNPNDAKCKGATEKTQCTYETVPDGQYPFYISARSDAGFDRYYAHSTEQIAGTTTNYLENAPFKTLEEMQSEASWYATEKPVGKINVTRGPVYFLDGSVAVFPNAPQLFNASTGPTFIPPYEIDFSVSRASTVEVAIVSLKDNVCSPVTPAVLNSDVNTTTEQNNKAGDICKFISTMTIVNTGNFDASLIRKAYWDGTDHNGNYVKPGIYEVRLTARNYPNPNQYQATVKSVPVNADLFKVFDLLEADGYSIAQRNTNMVIGYQVSVPMKVAVQIFKPGTTIYDYSKGTLRNPTTGKEVTDIREVLVRALVGIRPATTLINELWDGRDYAQQEVPDGTYPFRFVTAVDSAHIDSVTGEITAIDTAAGKEAIDYVADTYEYQNLHRATVAIGDGRFVCSDWEKTVFFYPNPFTEASKGTLEITKMPVPGTVSIKYFNLAGDLVKDSNYTCVDANNYMVQMGKELSFQPDNAPAGATKMTEADLTAINNIRNAALRCKWDRTNQHGRKVARGVYFGLVDFKAQNGREHCQKVVKVLVP